MVEMQLSALPSVQKGVLPHIELNAIAMREHVTDHYWASQDPLNELRIGWRAQTVRHMFHLLPGESVLELGCGSGKLTRALVHVTRGECPITAASFCFSRDHD